MKEIKRIAALLLIIIFYLEFSNAQNRNLIIDNKEDIYGFIDSNGAVIIDYQYNYVRDFSEGLAYVVKGDTCGFINSENKLVLNLTTEYRKQNYIENYNKTINIDRKEIYKAFGDSTNVSLPYLDKEDFYYHSISPVSNFSNGYALVKVYSEYPILNCYPRYFEYEYKYEYNRYSFIDKNGLFLEVDYPNNEIQSKLTGFTNATEFNNGYAQILIGDSLYYNVDTSGILNDFSISSCNCFENVFDYNDKYLSNNGKYPFAPGLDSLNKYLSVRFKSSAIYEYLKGDVKYIGFNASFTLDRNGVLKDCKIDGYNPHSKIDLAETDFYKDFPQLLYEIAKDLKFNSKTFNGVDVCTKFYDSFRITFEQDR